MRRAILLALATVACCTALTGCFTYDTQANYEVWRIIKTDLKLLNQDVRFILALEEPSPLDSYYR